MSISIEEVIASSIESNAGARADDEEGAADRAALLAHGRLRACGEALGLATARPADLFIFLAALHAPGVTRPLLRTPKLLMTGSGLARASHRV